MNIVMTTNKKPVFIYESGRRIGFLFLFFSDSVIRVWRRLSTNRELKARTTATETTTPGNNDLIG